MVLELPKKEPEEFIKFVLFLKTAINLRFEPIYVI